MSGIEAFPAVLEATVALVNCLDKAVDLGVQLKEFEDDLKPLLGRIEQVERDLDYAKGRRQELGESLRQHRSLDKWVGLTVAHTAFAVAQLKKHLPHGLEDPEKSTVKERAVYLLRRQKKMVNFEKSLQFAHASLLAAIGIMHQVALHPQEAELLLPCGVRPSAIAREDDTTALEKVVSEVEESG
ncbi:hypothetical protein ACJ41O_009966 [Fusarium nematophilum]